MPVPPTRSFSFTDFQVNNPTAPPPGNQLDSNFDQTNQSVSDVITWVSTSLNTDEFQTIRDADRSARTTWSRGCSTVSLTTPVSEVQPLVDQATAAVGAA